MQIADQHQRQMQIATSESRHERYAKASQKQRDERARDASPITYSLHTSATAKPAATAPGAKLRLQNPACTKVCYSLCEVIFEAGSMRASKRLQGRPAGASFGLVGTMAVVRLWRAVGCGVGAGHGESWLGGGRAAGPGAGCGLVRMG